MKEGENKSTSRMTGYLDKRGKWSMLGRWKKMWCVLEGSLLVYYKSRMQYFKKLSPCCGCTNMALAKNIQSNTGHKIHIITHSQIIILRTKNKQSQEEWYRAMTVHLIRYHTLHLNNNNLECISNQNQNSVIIDSNNGSNLVVEEKGKMQMQMNLCLHKNGVNKNLIGCGDGIISRRANWGSESDVHEKTRTERPFAFPSRRWSCTSITFDYQEGTPILPVGKKDKVSELSLIPSQIEWNHSTQLDSLFAQWLSIYKGINVNHSNDTEEEFVPNEGTWGTNSMAPDSLEISSNFEHIPIPFYPDEEQSDSELQYPDSLNI